MRGSLTRFVAVQLKPLIRPTKEILEITTIDYKWHQIFSKGTLFDNLVVSETLIFVCSVNCRVPAYVFGCATSNRQIFT